MKGIQPNGLQVSWWIRIKTAGVNSLSMEYTDLVRPAHRIAPESQVTGCVSEGLAVVLYVYPTETAFVPKNYRWSSICLFVYCHFRGYTPISDTPIIISSWLAVSNEISPWSHQLVVGYIDVSQFFSVLQNCVVPKKGRRNFRNISLRHFDLPSLAICHDFLGWMQWLKSAFVFSALHRSLSRCWRPLTIPGQNWVWNCGENSKLLDLLSPTFGQTQTVKSWKLSSCHRRIRSSWWKRAPALCSHHFSGVARNTLQLSKLNTTLPGQWLEFVVQVQDYAK